MEFVLGQLYQETNRNLEANAWFSQCIKRNGNLDMLFYARLNQAKESPNNESDKLLGKLLKENKYKDFFGEIWFARAELAQEAGNLESATLYFQKACQADGTAKEVLFASYTTLEICLMPKRTISKLLHIMTAPQITPTVNWLQVEH